MYLPYLAIILCQIFLRGGAAHAAVVATGFQDTVVTTVTSPSVLAFAPDGRLFIGEKASGRIRIYKSGGLLAQPFLDVNAFVPSGTYFDTFNERGLLGIAVDPSFNSNGFVYVYFTVCKAPANPPQPGTNTCQLAKNRVVRFTANGDVVTAGSQVVLLDDIDNDAGNHNSGWLGFGPLDGKLYVAVGDGGSNSAKAQDLGSLNGKILRIGANGAVPSNNPFVGQAGARGEVWARGLRNPFRCRFAPDGRLFCADVGANGWEEIDVIAKAANYGWPSTEGAFNAASFPQFTNPIYSYARGSVSSAIIGGEFGSKTGFPGNYQQSFFFGDFARGVIQRALLNGAGTAVQSVDDLVTGIGGNSLTDLLAGPDGALYYTVYGANQVRRVTATSSNRSPVAKPSADVLSGVPPLTVQFSSAGSSDPDGDAITYSWNFGDGTATSAVANPTHPYTASGTYVATLTVSDGKASPGPGTATVTITVGRAPEITITSPTDGASFRAGDLIAVAGSAVDPDDGPLPSASLHWKVIFHHADHTHPYIDDLPGSPQSFATNTGGEPDPDVGYEIQLSATDSTGLTGTDSVFILPVTSVVTLATSPAGLGLTLDGQPVTSPKTFTGVVGLARSIGAPSTQSVGGQSYYFGGWSDGGLPTHTILTPELDGTFTATFLPGATCNAPAVIPAQGGTFTGVTGGTSNQAGTCNITNNAPEQVFQWTPTVSGSATIDTCGGATSFDTVLYVRGGPCATGSQLACVDDIAGCTTSEPNDHHASRTALAVTAGQTYFIVVDGYNGASGTFSLTITPPTASAPTSTRTATPSRTVTLTPARTPTPTPTPTATALPTTSATIAGAPTPTRTVTPTFMGAPTPSATPVGGNLTQLGTIVAAVPNPIGGGSKNLQIIRDGNKPPVGSGNSGLQFDTFDGANTASEDWIGYVYPTTYTFQRVVFQEGMHFSNGGWFDTLTVQVRQGGAWTNVTGFVSTPTYPAINNGVSYETYTLTFNDAVGDGIRIDGAPGGSNDFFSVGELEVYGGSADPMATPTRTMTPTLSPTSAATRTSTPAPTVTNVTTATATPVVNDCSNPTLVPANGGTFTGITNGSNTQAGSCALTNKVGERVFQWTPTISGRALVSTCGSGTLYDTVVYIRTGTCGGGAELGCNDDTAGCGTGEPNDHHGSRLSPLVVAGQTYFIVVDGYDTSAGQFTLTIGVPVATTATPIATVTPIVTSTPLPPTPVPPATASTVVPTALPSPCGATILPAQGGTFTGVTSGSNVEAGSCGLTNMGPETIYQWTPTASGTATIATCGTGTLYDTVLYMRNGSCRGGELACNDDVAGCGTGEPNDHHGSRLTPTVTAGQTYFIVVDGYNGGQGAFSLTITPPPTAVATPSS